MTICLCKGRYASAQIGPPLDNPKWTWAELAASPGVDATAVRWLRDSMPESDVRYVFGLLSQVTKPEVAQILPSFMVLDGATLRPGPFQALRDSLSQRPPAGIPGAVRVAYLLSRSRSAFLHSQGVYKRQFEARSFALPTAARPAAPRPDVSIHLQFDFAPAESLIAIVSTPDITASQVMRRISTPAFDALIAHHSASFYPLPLSRELLSRNLALAASTSPVEALYAYGQPAAFEHYGDVRRNVAEYRRALTELQRHQAEILCYVQGRIAPMLPANSAFSRTVSFYFADGADGWAVGSVAAMDLDYYKDDWERLIDVMAHEAFHSAQAAVLPNNFNLFAGARTFADSTLRRATYTIFLEGTATYVTPPIRRSAADSASQVAAGLSLLERIGNASDSADRRQLLAWFNEGVASGGPFYWLGGAMTAAIIESGGLPRIRAALAEGDARFFNEYAVTTAHSSATPRFSDALRAALARNATRM